MWTPTSQILAWFYFFNVTLAFMAKTDYLKWNQHLIPNNKVQTKYLNDMHNNLKLRHQSRFPNLDRILTKIDFMHNSDLKNSVGSNSKSKIDSWNHMKVSRTTPNSAIKDDDIFEQYGDLENEEQDHLDYEEDYADDVNSKERDADDDYNEDEDDDDFNENLEWQAEEPTETTTTAEKHGPRITVRTLSPFGQMKWQNYGTRAKVEERRRTQDSSGEANYYKMAASLARNHFLKISNQTVCKRPFPKVISILAEHPDRTKTYTPHCTVLYRCAEDTGCCSQTSKRCGPKTQEEVDLYFYAKSVGMPQSTIEKLSFINHTECECIDKEPNPKRSSRQEPPINLKKLPQNLLRCQCPGMFTPKFKYGSKCTCDCKDEDEACGRMKKGNEYLGYTDRICISERKCGTPICEYGAYLRTSGRCPRKKDKLDEFQQQNININ